MKRFSWLLFVCTLIGSIVGLNGRELTKPVEGLHSHTPRVHALVNATIITAPGESIEEGSVVIRNGLIEAVGKDIHIPQDARVWDCSKLVIYPGFIEAYSTVGMPNGLKPHIRQLPTDPNASPRKKEPTPTTPGASYWNPLITPERAAIDYLKIKSPELDNLNALGFTVAATYPARGILRGKGALVLLEESSIHESSLSADISQHIALDFDYRSDDYPSSLMGVIALLRQTLYDAKWYDEVNSAYRRHPDKVEPPELNIALDSLLGVVEGTQLALIQANDELDYSRINAIAKEFELNYSMLGNGYEYRQSYMLKQMDRTIVLPLAFPEAPPVERMDAALGITLDQLEHWELAPSNAAFMEKFGIPFCLTAYHLEDPLKDFWKSMRLAVKRGLSEDSALAAITTEPANLYSMSGQLGTIEKGKLANLVVATGNLFADDKADVSMVWVRGNPVEQDPWSMTSIEGSWRFTWDSIEGFPNGIFKSDDEKLTLKVGEMTFSGSIQGEEILLYVTSSALGIKEQNTSVARLRAKLKGNSLEGTVTGTGMKPIAWKAELLDPMSAEITDPKDNAQDSEPDEPVPELVFAKYPAGAYGVGARIQPDEILIKDATIWTSAPDGILHESDLLIRKGKIAAVGRNLKASKKATVIDATGKHVTAGIIDCHSHLAISDGVNEGTSAVSSEVRIQDVINPRDINIYRQLAGGVTVSNSLHGSANPIGGQNQLLRLRWGQDADGIKFSGVKPSIKFALGENVKQSNWGPEFNTRYPQTRMGVVEIMESNFRAAEDYERRWEEFRNGESLLPPRKDLRMQALLETLRGERAIHIHSYRQDEILEFSLLAKKLNLHVSAFQHVLEGFKVAEAMTEIDAGGSSFADWWSYKFEVYDAIPHNPAIMHKAGVLVSVNSDDAEMATRLNTEAAKSIKYGGLSEIDALNFVTINPAIQLGIENLVGSLEPGKAADFVIWSDHPLSTYAHAEQTWIEGIKYFDRNDDKALTLRDSRERERLIQKALRTRLKKLKMFPEEKKAGKKGEGEQ